MGVVAELAKPRQRNAQIFERIRLALENKGISRTFLQIRSRWKTLKQLYWKEKAKRRQGGPCGSNYFQFYKVMDSLLGGETEEVFSESEEAGGTSVLNSALMGVTVAETTHEVDMSSCSEESFSLERGRSTVVHLEELCQDGREPAGQQRSIKAAAAAAAPPASWQAKQGPLTGLQQVAPPVRGAVEVSTYQETVVRLLEEQVSLQRQLVQEHRELHVSLERMFQEQRQHLELLSQRLLAGLWNIVGSNSTVAQSNEMCTGKLVIPKQEVLHPTSEPAGPSLSEGAA
nr:PREDICTED: uncharacterized protein LOC106706305 [Latimeria chalumnae]|eukprot:XP_014352538.1 PREDICTED: uncharacterized protein LOC106706305 [Latimeria chalumnae]